jgi:hypothetical protein
MLTDVWPGARREHAGLAATLIRRYRVGEES